MDNKYLTKIFEGSLNGETLDEIVNLCSTVAPGVAEQTVREVHRDITAFFSGSDPNFVKSTLPYHNLRHSQMVVLATTRLFHGLHCSGVAIDADTLFKGVLAAYFHDTGLLVEEGDSVNAGTDYMANHEERSINLLRRYVEEKNFADEIARDCATIIYYTDLKNDPSTLAPHPCEIQMAGQIVGSADIIAQMADRYYLECLPLLYYELEAGGLNEHNSALELMEHTANFYHNVVLRRLVTTFSNTSKAMRAHFRERYTIDRNLYIENIDKNIAYLKEIIKKCENIECLKRYLKREPPTI